MVARWLWRVPSIANTANITLAAGTTFDVSVAGGFTVAAGKALRGNGNWQHCHYGSKLSYRPGVGGVGTLTLYRQFESGVWICARV